MARSKVTDKTAKWASRRRAALARATAAATVEAMLVTSPHDVGYLTGFTGADSSVMFGRGWAQLVTDGRYAEQAGRECGDIDIHVRSGSMARAVAETLTGRKVRRLGVQAEHVTLRMADALKAAIGGRKLRPISDLTGPLRGIKDADELRAIRKAVTAAQRAFKELISGGRRRFVGRSEREVACELDHLMRRFGASAPSFETTVAAGSHSSLPHHRPGATRIRRNQAVLIDWGAVVDGYCSDLTRVVFTGRIPPELIKVYEVVLCAQKAGIAAVSSGVSSRTADGAARKVIERAGYGRQFLHSLGHGIGREVHEGPALSGSVKGRLRKNMVVTVEPGIYLPGIGGIRIEDDVLVTSHGSRRLSSLPRNVEAMVLR